MSLLDQLSSLCIPSASSNYQPSFLSFNLDSSISYLPSLTPTQPSSAQKPEPATETKSSQIHNSQQKMIKLFDDEELKPTWRLIKTDKKSNQQPKIETNLQENLSEFTVDQPKKDNQAIFTQLTKIFYLFNTKLRKINYEFFVKLQEYSKAVLKEKALMEEESRKAKASKIEKGLLRLHETLQIINLKYFQPQQEQVSTLNWKNNKIKAFDKIKWISNFYKKYSFAEKCMRKQVYRGFLSKLQQRNKKAIKIDLFTELLESIVKKKSQQNLSLFLRNIRFEYRENQFSNYAKEMESSKMYESSRMQNFQAQRYHQHQEFYQIEMKTSCPISYPVLKAENPRFVLQNGSDLEINGREKIPLKLHNLKTHDQQVNLNDCVDNGHLLMNQMKNNTSFRQELDNLTISNINNKTNNTSVNSSLLAYENLILPQANQEKEDLISYRAITMRKQSRPTQDILPVTEDPLAKQVKKSRKSLVITKRKQSANDIHSYAQTLANAQNHQIPFDPKKPKSTTNSNSKIPSKPSHSDKQVIKRMLQELHKKFTCQDKIIKISLSNKKQTSNAKKQKSQSSGKNLQRKKIRSQIAPVTTFNQKINKKDSDKKSAQKESYRIDLTDKKQEEKKNSYQEKKKIKGKNSDNSFMSVTLNKTVTTPPQNPSTLQKQNVNHKNLVDQRTKQNHSEMSKKNINGKCPSQSSEESQICKILSKYRSKKPSIPQCSMKIDLVTSKVNKVLSLAQNNGKEKNKIFFNNIQSSLDQTYDDKIQPELIGDTNLEISKSYLRPSDDTYLIKRNSMNHLSSQTDSVMGEYLSMLPSNIYFQQNQEDNDGGQSKPGAVNTSLDNSECFFTGSKPRPSSKPNSLNTSMDKKRASFQKNLQEWDMMFEKQKSKFLKNDSKIKRKSTLNEEVICEIKNKIEQCLILGHKDTNVPKGPYLQLKKCHEKGVLEEKNTLMNSNNTVKLLSTSNSNRNSINKLYTTNKLTKRMES